MPDHYIKEYLEDIMRCKFPGKLLKVPKEKADGIMGLIQGKLIEQKLGVFPNRRINRRF